MENLTIRPAAETDARALIGYLDMVGAESDNLLFGAGGCGFDEAQEARFIAAMRASSNSCMLLGLDAGEIVSVCTLQGGFRPRIAHRAELAVSVRRSHWRRGVGTAMLTALIAQAKRMGLRVIELQVRVDNAPAIALYEKMGFEKISTFAKFMCVDGVFYDAYLMNLYL